MNFTWLSLGSRLITILLIVSSGIASAAWGGRGVANETTEPYRTWQMPGTSLASPSGYGAQWGQFFLGGGYQNRARFTTTSDASLGVGTGIGNAQKYVGVELALNLFDISSFKNGAVNVKLHRQLPKGFGLAVGREAALSFGDTQTNTVNGETANGVDPRDKSWFGSVSKIFFLRDETQWFSALTLTAGAGNGRFRSQTARDADESTVGIFGSAAIRVKQPVAFIADWTGQDLNLGLSITPIRTFPFFINPVLADVTRTAGDGTRFTLGVGMAFTFI